MLNLVEQIMSCYQTFNCDYIEIFISELKYVLKVKCYRCDVMKNYHS